MIGPGASVRRTRRRAGPAWFRDAAFVVAGAILALTVGMTAWSLGSVSFGSISVEASTAALLAGIVYLASHLGRIARLALIAADARLSLRLLSNIHFFTSGVSLALPFKLGDAYRVVELSRVTAGFARAVTLVYVERVLDVAALLLLLVAAMALGSPVVGDYAPVLIASLLFVSATLILIVLVPDNLRRVGSYIIKRYDRPWTIQVLRRIAEIRAVIGGISGMLRGRYTSLFAFTILIWSLEALSLGLVLSAFDAGIGPLDGLLKFLSSITQGETLLDRASPGDMSRLSTAAFAYLLTTQVPLVALATVASVPLLASRLSTLPRPFRVRRSSI